jgi:hypothetical protein
VNCYKSLQKLNEDSGKLLGQLKELEEAVLPIARLLVPHPGGPKNAPLVDRLKEAPSRLATYVKHLAKSIPNQILAYMKSYFPKALVDVVARRACRELRRRPVQGVAGANGTDCRTSRREAESSIVGPVGLALGSICNINKRSTQPWKYRE